MSQTAPQRPAANPVRDFATVGAIAAGVVLLDAALLPGLVIGGAVVFAPRVVPGLRRFSAPVLNTLSRLRTAVAPPPPLLRPAATSGSEQAARVPGRFAIGQAVAKTITFRIIVTSIDFTSNYIVIGDAASAAGLSAISLAVGPFFYLVHETAWNYYGPSVKRKAGLLKTAIDLPFPRPLQTDSADPQAVKGGFTISRALAKTITFRTIATTMDFATTYVVLGDFTKAVVLSATGFVLGPFIYLGHEMAWDHFGAHDTPIAEASVPEGPVPTVPSAVAVASPGA